MNLEQWLQFAFDYDAWANRIWAQRIGDFRNPERATQIFQHMINAQRIWIERCGAQVEFDKHDEHLANVAENMAQAWRMVLDATDLDEDVAYKNLRGEPFVNTVAEIALHVINHGTYHRGHLRGLAEAEGLEFSDTDLILFFREQNGKSVSS